MPLGALASAPLLAQDSNEEGETEAEAPVVINILSPPPEDQTDAWDIEQCEREADVARIQGEIVVCRSLSQSDDSGWDQREFERRYAEVSQGVKAPDVYHDPTPTLFGITVSTGLGEPPPPPVIVDFDDLPEAPPDSDADRRGRGLPPRN
ncbi:MAG: hypothetical protein AAF697_08085 [Pseudomonadota bacterium]